MSEENVKIFVHKDVDQYNGYPIHILHITWKRHIDVTEIAELVDRIIDNTRELDGDSILVLSGRLSFWLYVIISHTLMQKYIAVAVFDPKLRGAVICISHVPSLSVGAVISLEDFAEFLIEKKRRKIDDVEALF